MSEDFIDNELILIQETVYPSDFQSVQSIVWGTVYNNYVRKP